jgi:hypothetical protein
MKKSWSVLAVVLVLLSASAALAPASAQDAPLQSDIYVRISRPVDGRNFKAELEGGTATVRGRVFNMDADGTVYVTLRFDYRSGADIALDEIIDRIVVTVENQQRTEVFGISTIDPNDINLNPNRAPLTFATTLYRSPVAISRDYWVRIRVYGNYE